MKTTNQILEELVDFYPESSNTDNIKKLLDYVQKFLAELRQFDYVKVHEHSGVYSLTAMPASKTHCRYLLQGHIDVVPKSEGQVFKIIDDRIYGRGVYDMLFGVASFLNFLSENRQSIKDIDVGLMLTGDEELGGYSGVKKLLEDGYTADVCILPDAGEALGDMSISAKGVFNIKLEISGVSHHGSRPWEGDGAGNKLILMMNELFGEFDFTSRDESTITVSELIAGEAMNQGPSKAIVRLDVRYKDKADLARIKTSINTLCQSYSAKIVESIQGSSYHVDTNNSEIARFIDKYQSEANKNVTFSKSSGSSDARFFYEKDIPVIMFRPDGGNAHGDNEWVSSSSLQKFDKLLSSYLLDSIR